MDIEFKKCAVCAEKLGLQALCPSCRHNHHLIEILKTAKGSFILLDETYFHFVFKSYVQLIKTYQNLIVTQTFSKAYGLTGLRLGMMFSHKNNIINLAKVNLPFSVNTLVLKAASVALDDQKFIRKVVKNVQTDEQG